MAKEQLENWNHLSAAEKERLRARTPIPKDDPDAICNQRRPEVATEKETRPPEPTGKFLAQLLDGDNKIIGALIFGASDWYEARVRAAELPRPRAADGAVYPWHRDEMNRNIRVTPVR